MEYGSFAYCFSLILAFALLAVIGGNMVREAFSREEEEADASLSFRKMLPLAIATSIDALAVGVSFAFLQVHICTAAFFIGAITFLLSGAGVKVGSLFGARYEKQGGAGRRRDTYGNGIENFAGASGKSAERGEDLHI